MKGRGIYLAIPLTILGIFVSFYLFKLHIGSFGEGHWFLAGCSISKAIDCKKVDASPYSVFLGIPVALWGMFFYIVILNTSLFRILFEKVAGKIMTYMGLFLLIIGAIVDIILFAISIFIIRSLCLYCFLTYVITFLLLYIFWKDSKHIRAKSRSIFMKPKGRTSVIIMYALMTFIGAMIVWVLDAKYSHKYGIIAKEIERNGGKVKKKSRDELEAKIKEYVNNFFTKKVEDVSWIKSELVMGSKNPKIVLIEFSDFECPFCRAFAMSLRKVYEKYKDELQIVFKHFPLSTDCNPHLTLNMHPYACELAYASMCAHKYGKFEEFYNLATNIQNEIGDNTYMNILNSIGITKKDYISCMKESKREIEKYISDDIEDGMKINITATPTIFINGRRIEGFVPPIILDEIFKRILKKEGK